MKKVRIGLLGVALMIAIMLSGVFNITASAATTGTTGDCTWSLDGTVLTISGNGAMGDYSSVMGPFSPWGCSVSEVIIEEGVTTIGSSAFYHCRDLTSVTIADSVTLIKAHAFSDCSKLTSITIPANVSSIGYQAFYNCSALRDVVMTDGSNIFFDEYVFRACTSLYTFNIPDGVTHIPSYMFTGCTSLSNVTIPDSVTHIDEWAFDGCYNLKNITIPESVIFIKTNAFTNCYALENINVSDSNSNFSSIDGVLFNHNGTSLLKYPKGKEKTSYTIPDGVTCIDGGAFFQCYNLCEIIIPYSVTSISSGAFIECNRLYDVYYKGSETEITIGSDNYDLRDATWHYNICFGTTPHAYSYGCDPTCDVCGKPNPTITHSFTLNRGNTCEDCKFSKAPNAPTVYSITSNSVTLEAIEGFEYSMDGVTWQSSNVFDNLKANTEYTFYQRVAESEISFSGEKSEPATAVTNKKVITLVANPVVMRVTATSVTLAPYTGYEYSMDGVTWQKDNEFTGLTADTSYTFCQRVAETNEVEASVASPTITVTTLAKSSCSIKPVAPIIAETTTDTVTLVAREGYEYSKNGTTWQKSNVFTNLSQNTSYTFYQRVAETDTEKASDKSAGTKTKTASVAVSTGVTSDTYYQYLRQYIDTYGRALSSGNMAIIYSSASSSGDMTFYYRIENTNEGISFELLTASEKASYLAQMMDFTLTDSSKYIDVNYTMLYYYYGDCIDTVDTTKRIDRSTYTGSNLYYTYEEGIYIPADYFQESFNMSLELLCRYWNVNLNNNLGFGLKSLGFVSFDGTGPAACDVHSSYHMGSFESRGSYDATCTTDGYTGDYYCSVCGNKSSSGRVIKCVGYHVYSNDCDNTCNVCGENRVIAHFYSDACDTECDVCTAKRDAVDHVYDNRCDGDCNECDLKRIAPHSYDSSESVICNLCGEETDVATYLLTTDGVEATKAYGSKVTISTERFEMVDGLGYAFDYWVVESENATLEFDADVYENSIVMPGEDVVITSAKYLIGDINGDGKVNALDKVALSDIIKSGGDTTKHFDVDMSNAVNARDKVAITKIIKRVYDYAPYTAE